MATRREYYFLIKKLRPFAHASITRWQPERDQLSDGLGFTLYERSVPGWGINPFYLLLDGRIVRLTHDRDLNPRWLEIDVETYDFGPNGWSSGPVGDRDRDFGPLERADGAVIATMLDRLATEPLRGLPVRIPASYPLEEVRRTLLLHVEEETKPHQQGSEWGPIILMALVPIALLVVAMIVVFLTTNVQVHW